MTTSEIGEILYDACRKFGVHTELAGNLTYSEIEGERIVISVGKIQDGKYWCGCPVKINWCVPDVNHEEDSIRMKAVQKELESLEYGIGDHDGRYFRYKAESRGTGEDRQMCCHFANLTLKFQIQNILNYGRYNRKKD